MFCDEIVATPITDGDGGELADGQGLVNMHGAVDFRGVPGAAGQAGAFDEHTHGFSDLPLIDFGRDRLQRLHCARPAARRQ